MVNHHLIERNVEMWSEKKNHDNFGEIKWQQIKSKNHSYFWLWKQKYFHKLTELKGLELNNCVA